MFDPDDAKEALYLDAELGEVDKNLEVCKDAIGHGLEGQVPVEYYEGAMSRSRKLNWCPSRLQIAAY